MKSYSYLSQNRFVSHLRTTFCALAIAGASLTFPSAKGDPFPAGGTYSPCFVQIGETQHAGPNLIAIYRVTADAVGTFYGALVDGIERDVIHPDGSITFEGSATFVSAYGGCGTVQFRYGGRGNIYTHEETGHFVGTQGTGCLAGIYSTGTFHGYLNATREGCDVAGDNVSYEGQVVLAP